MTSPLNESVNIWCPACSCSSFHCNETYKKRKKLELVCTQIRWDYFSKIRFKTQTKHQTRFKLTNQTEKVTKKKEKQKVSLKNTWLEDEVGIALLLLLSQHYITLSLAWPDVSDHTSDCIFITYWVSNISIERSLIYYAQGEEISFHEE